MITVLDIHALWQDLHALSIAPFEEYAVTYWLNRFPGGLDVEGVESGQGSKSPVLSGR
ncbi:hypothetical protein HLB27_07610 [Dickeya dadantii]|uniref:hypothetical protein n=1 Tax=Dickeya dadantii TaxID=204038 RepID=UPI001495C563|nr:hypothetical protein [Dickeya dadantii]NPE60727.1 hypothetical protein [Dickeya dadantii]NPE70532.1 hypothetical protein [Dickeya dadantii]